MRNLLLHLTLLLCVLSVPASAGVYEVRVSGDRLTVHAENAPIQEILRHLAAQGIEIQADPRLNPVVSASFENRDIQKGLESLLRSLNHVFIWKSVPGSREIRLAEIQLFDPGYRDRMENIGNPDGFDVVRDTRDGTLYVRDEILLRAKPGVSGDAFRKLIREVGGTVIDANAVGVYRVRLPAGTDVPALVDRIARHPAGADAEPNYAYPVNLPYRIISPDKPVPPDLPLSQGMVDGTPIAVLDSGLMPDAGMSDYVVASLDAVNPGSLISDGLGHGTQMAMIAAGTVRPMGVTENGSPSNPVIPIRTFDDKGVTTNYALMNGIDFALEKGARVLNLSWGTETNSRFLESAMNYADDKGLIIVASAGNEPTGKPVYPAAYPSVIGVSALAPDGNLWDQSNYGDFVSLSAPGFAELPVGYQARPGAYAGTSIASAYVANAAAGFLAEQPDAGKREVLGHLQQTFRPVPKVPDENKKQ